MWGDCFQVNTPQQGDVTEDVFSRSSAMYGTQTVPVKHKFPLGDFLSVLASEGYSQPASNVEGLITRA